MQYKKYEMNSFNLYTIKTDKFKNCHMEIIFRKQVEEKNVTKRVFLNDLITYSSSKYPTKKEVNICLEELYNTHFYNVTTRVGNALMSIFMLDFIAPKYIEEDILEEYLELPFSFLFKPNIKDGAFDLNSYNVIKNRLDAEFDTLRENASKYAIRRAIKNMENNSISSITLPGIKEELEDISREDLVKEHISMLESDLCDIYIIGDLDMDYVASIIEKKCLLRSLKRETLELLAETKPTKKEKVIKESDNFSQAQLVMIYNLLDFTDRERNSVINIFNSIFGSASISNKLAQNLREKNSLCYTVTSIPQRFDNLLFVYAGIDSSNFDIAVKLVKKSLKEMQIGDFTEEDVEFAKLDLITALKLGEDSQNRLIDNYVFNTISNRALIQEEIKTLKSISKEEVVAVANKIKLNITYLLQDGGEDVERN